jgi:hypothetical protein
LHAELYAGSGARRSRNELALSFMREKLAAFDIERTEVLGGKVMVSRALAEVLEPAHA